MHRPLSKVVFGLLALTLATATPLLAASHKESPQGGKLQAVGVVNFQNCIEQSKLGKQEANSFEAMQNQMVGQMESTQKELQEIITKLQDREYLDGISPEAEQQLQMKGQQLSQTMEAQQQQFRAILQQAQMKMVQLITNQISRASEIVAQKQGLDLVLHKDVLFYSLPSYEITDKVVAEMNTLFDKESGEHSGHGA